MIIIRGGGTGTHSTAIAVPKLKQVGLSRTKTGAEIAVKLIPLQSDMTIIVSMIMYLYASIDRGPARIGRTEHPTWYAHTHWHYTIFASSKGACFSTVRGRGQNFARAVATSRTNSLILSPPLLCLSSDWAKKKKRTGFSILHGSEACAVTSLNRGGIFD